MAYRIGPSFLSELEAAGISPDGFSWDPKAGEILFTEAISPETRGAIDAVLATHVPSGAVGSDSIRALKVALVQSFMDQKAQALGYDSIASAISYSDEPAVPKFQMEGQAMRAWRSLVWEKANQIMAAVEAGAQRMPSDDELLSQLPVLAKDL